MLIINNTDVIEGGASVASVVDYTISGFTSGTTPINLATGVLSTTLTTVLVTASAVTCVVGIILVNTHSAAVEVTLRIDPANGAAPRYVIPKAISLGIGYRLATDGVKFTVTDTNGAIVTTGSVSDTAYNEATWNDVTAIAPSKNAVRDEFENRVPLSLFDAQTILAAVSDNSPVAVAVAVQQVIGRLTGGNIKGLTATELTALLNAATTALQGAVELDTVTETVAGVDTSRAVTAEGAHAAIAVDKNPLARAQGVNMTAAASGSSGIMVADSVHLDQGTGAFTLSCKRNLASYVVAAILMEKHDDTTGYRFSTVVTTGYLKLEINDTTYTSSAAPSIVAGTEREFTVTVSPGTTNTTVTFYCDGIIVGTAQTATNETTTDNAVSFYAMGTDAIRTAGINKGDLVYNRALTAAEVLDLYRNGINFADKWGNQTNTVGNPEFVSNTTGWTSTAYVISRVDSEIDPGTSSVTEGASDKWVAKLEATAASGRLFYSIATVTVKTGQHLYVSFMYYNPTGNPDMYCSQYPAPYTAMIVTQGNLTTKDEWTLVKGYVLIATAGAVQITVGQLSAGGADTDLCYVDAFNVHPEGATLALEGEGIQIGKWYDSSSNNLDASYPAAGSSLIRKPFRGVTQPTPSAKTTAVTLTITELLTRIITGTHTAGATQAYTLPTGTLCEAGGFFNINDSIDWVLINLSAAAADTITVTAGATHTIVGNPIVQAAHASTGGIYGNSATFRTRKTALNTFVTYRIS
uniref:Uncharacterized protein n=1 Tax=viral metagenome TaxID=1070528 RepID=A0A6M3KPE4_9ZZZZ